MLHNAVQNKKSKTKVSEWYTFPKMGNHKITSNHIYRLLMFSIRPHIYITAQEDMKCSQYMSQGDFLGYYCNTQRTVFLKSIQYVLKAYILLNSPLHVNCFILHHYKPKNEQLTQLHKPASKPIQTISQKQTSLFFFTEQKLFFCCLGFDRVQRLEPHHLLKLVYKARVVCAHGQSPEASQSERSSQPPMSQAHNGKPFAHGDEI